MGESSQKMLDKNEKLAYVWTNVSGWSRKVSQDSWWQLLSNDRDASTLSRAMEVYWKPVNAPEGGTNKGVRCCRVIEHLKLVQKIFWGKKMSLRIHQLSSDTLLDPTTASFHQLQVHSLLLSKFSILKASLNQKNNLVYNSNLYNRGEGDTLNDTKMIYFVANPIINLLIFKIQNVDITDVSNRKMNNY